MVCHDPRLHVQRAYGQGLVPEDQRICPDCDTLMETMGWQYVREELRITPEKAERIRYMQEVLVCPGCREELDTTIVKASVPTALLAHSPASPSMVAFVMYQRFLNSVPFYRQEMDWLQKGAPLARETTANWCIRCALDYFLPVYDRLHVYLVKRDVIHADETTCQMLHEEGRAPSSTSYMWIYLSGNDGLAPIVLYEYQPGRKGEYARNFLEGFSGMLECDGYTGYNSVEAMMPWSDFIKERCSGIIDTTTETPENRGLIPAKQKPSTK